MMEIYLLKLNNSRVSWGLELSRMECCDYCGLGEEMHNIYNAEDIAHSP